jgi:hypothetical protein
MAQMPTEQAALALATLDALRTDCQVSQPAFDALAAQTGDLGDEIRGLSLLPREVVCAAAADRNLAPIETARIGLMWRIARRIAWVREGHAWAAFLELATEDANWWDEQVTRLAAAWIARGGQRVPVTVEEHLEAKTMPGYESKGATPKRKKRKDGSPKRKKRKDDPTAYLDGKTEICMMWNKKVGTCAGVAACPMGRAHRCWICLSTEHTGTDGVCL